MGLEFAAGKTRIGWIGTGVMGTSMCGHLMAAGTPFEVSQCARSVTGQFLSELGKSANLREGFRKVIVASIGPSTTETLASLGVTADMEPSHPKMGILVKEAAERSAELLAEKSKR